MTSPVVVGAVLCGGASRRMGRDKALIPRHGQALAVRVADALWAGGCDAVWAVGGDTGALGDLGLAVVADDRPGEGPLGAVATALVHVLVAAAGGATLVLAPCDVLDPDPEVVRAVLAALAGARDDVDVAVPVAAGRTEWIHSAWAVRPPVVAAVEGLLEAGHRRLDAVAEVVRAVTVDGVDARSLADADRPEDLLAPSTRVADRPDPDARTHG